MTAEQTLGHAPAQAVASGVVSRPLSTIADLLTADGAALRAARAGQVGALSTAVD